MLVYNAAVIGAAALVQWLWSLKANDVTVADVFWGFGFAIVAWLSFALADGAGLRQWLLACLATVWGVRLGGYLWWRGRGKPEDPRYQEIRAGYGESFRVMSLPVIFGFQGGLLLVVALPLQVGQLAGPEVGPIQWAGVALWAIGFGFESIGDLQLARFKSDPANEGKVLDRGLWRYTRHPNYFGDFLVWWGLFLIAIDSVQQLWIAAGPLVMTVLLLRVSGVPLLEKNLRQRAGYAEYIERTSAFFPWPPRRGPGRKVD